MGKRVGIIGAGISGLLACKHTMQMGLEPIVFEAKGGIGGVWSQTIESTKLQTPKDFYQFSDFPWPNSVRQTFPDHNQVLEYIQAYAKQFNILPRIRFNTRVTCIDYVNEVGEDVVSCDLWGGTGEPFSPTGRWNVSVVNALDPSDPVEVYEVDFMILCIGRYSDLPNIPHFPLNKGPEVFQGQVLHSMDYAAIGPNLAAELVKNKKVAVIGFQKSAVDVASEIANINGEKHPCTLVFKTVHWTVPDYLLELNIKSLNRFSELMVHKPGGGFLLWFLAILLSPLLWIFSKFTESFLKWAYPLKKYNMIPSHGYFKQIFSCMVTVLPTNFYSMVKEGRLVLKRVNDFYFCNDGLVIDGNERTPLATDVVIFATGYKSEEKLKGIFKSTYLQKCIIGSSIPFYRECIHPRIPQLAILGYADSPAILHTTEMRSKWVAHLLAGKFKLPSIGKMEAEMAELEKCMRTGAKESYKKSCVSVMLQIYCNDQLCKDMGYNPRRKSSLLSELFSAYTPNDYRNLC